VTSRHCPCDRYSNYLSRPLMLILRILIIILMLEHHSPTHSCDPTVLCGVGAGIVDPSFGLFNRVISFRCVSAHSCNFCCVTHFHLCASFFRCATLTHFIRSCWLEFSQSSYVIQIQISIYRARGARPWDSIISFAYPLCEIQVHSVIFAPLHTSLLSCQCDLHGYQLWYPTSYLAC
jgi:hypothetical protein